MSEKLSYVERLEKEDIEKILEVIGLELDNDMYDREGEHRDSLLRGKSDDGNGFIIAFCNNREQQELESEIARKLYKESQVFREFYNNLMSLGVAMAGLGGFGGFSAYSNNKVMLNFEDFTLTESLSLKSEEDEIKYDLMMTEVYHKFMEAKFGKEYTKNKDEYFKKLQEQAEADEKNQKAEAEEEARERE